MYVVVDIETTGLSRHVHKITEIAAAIIEDGEITREFQTLINPQVRIPSFITKLTGIDNEMVKDAPYLHEVMPAFKKFIGDNIFIAHNATFDYNFLSHTGNLKNKRLCTRRMANKVIPNLPSKKLAALCEHYDVVNVQAHRAMADVHATAQIFLKMQESNPEVISTLIQ